MTKNNNKGSGVLIALDPSPNNTGVAVISFSKLGMHSSEAIAIKTIRQGKNDDNLNQKGVTALLQVKQMILDYEAEFLVAEKVASVGFGMAGKTNYNTTSAQTKMEGIIEFIAADYGLPLELLTPTKWKAGYGIKGDKQKDQAITIAAHYSGEHYSIFDEHSAEAYLMGLYAARNVALVQVEQTRLL